MSVQLGRLMGSVLPLCLSVVAIWRYMSWTLMVPTSKELTYSGENETDFDNLPTALAWSPNSQRIVFERAEEIYIVEFVD